MPGQPAQSGASEHPGAPCKQCGAAVHASPAERAWGGGLYCSRACFAAARSAPAERACAHCGRAFLAPAWAVRRGGGTYCGVRCRAAAARGRERPELRTCVATACAICGTVRAVRPSVLAGGNGAYCSRACANVGKRRPRKGTRDPEAWVAAACQHCEKERDIPRSRAARGDGRYCDRACRSAARRGEGAGVPRADGYVVARRADGTWDLAHRVAMESILGRRLTRVEDVRHRDGIRGNNDRSNLELATLPLPGPGRARRLHRSPGWGAGHDACTLCHGTARPHVGHGLCRLCYNRRWRGIAPEAYRI